MVIIKNKECRVTSIKVYKQYLPILHTTCKMVITKDVEWLLLKFTSNIYSYYVRLIRLSLLKIKDVEPLIL